MSSKYLDCLFSNNFLPIISRATHFGGPNPTCIDHILTNDLTLTYKSGIIHDSVSYHFPTFVSLDFNLDPRKVTNSKPRIKINEFLVKSFINEFSQVVKDIVSDSDSTAETCFSYFYDNFRLLYDKWFVNPPSSSYRNQNNLRKEWITIGLAKSSAAKNELFDTWSNNKTKINWNRYIDYKRVHDKLSNKVKYDYYDKKFKANQGDLKKTWRLINNILGRKRSNRLLTFPNSDAAHKFNFYFINIANDLISKSYGNSKSNDENSFKSYMPDESENHLSGYDFKSEDVKIFISKLNNSKGTYFSPRVLKLVTDILSPTLAFIFNKCLSEGYFPKELKVAKIIPLYKNKGSISEISNYRPISMLSVFSKIFEKLIHKQLTNFFDTNDTLNSSQYGFRRKHSTLHALINAAENLYHSIDNKHYTLGIFIDFSKAFDTVNHVILIEKLRMYGLRDNMLNLLKNYLVDRKQYVSYGGIESTLLDITCGVPQGSVLGPLLFIIFINDLVNISDIGKFVLFADDLNLFLAHKDRYSLYRQANQILHKLYDYCFANRLIINYDKCCFIEFNIKEDDDPLILGIMNHLFCQVDKCKFLGVYINSKLSWDDQIKHVISQVSKSCGSIYSIRLHVPQKVLRNIYMALVQPYLIYCISLWGSLHKSKTMERLFILQKKCIRIISKKTERVKGILQHTKPIFHRYRILNVFNLYYYITASVAMKIVRLCTPKALFDFYVISERSNRFILPLFSLTSNMNKSFVFNSMKILNYLLQHDIEYHDLSFENFKARLKKHLLAIQFKSVNKGDDYWLPCNHDIFSFVSV